jgi:plastocyanin
MMIKLGQIVFAVGSMALVACGGSTAAVDGAPAIDSPPPTVTTVSCTGATIAATVTDPGFKYVSTPAGSAPNDSAIKVNDIVEFNLAGGMDHPVGPDAAAGMTDSGIHAADSMQTCLKFSAVGTFHYECTVHLFKGTVTVTQ